MDLSISQLFCAFFPNARKVRPSEIIPLMDACWRIGIMPGELLRKLEKSRFHHAIILDNSKVFVHPDTVIDRAIDYFYNLLEAELEVPIPKRNIRWHKKKKATHSPKPSTTT